MRACSFQPISTTTASPRPPTASIPTAASCDRASRARSRPAPTAATTRSPSTTNCRPRNSSNSSSQPSKDTSKKTEEIVNYEISRVTKTEVTEAGRVNRISVAVLVDGVYGKNEKGETIYAPRSKDDLDRISTLVRSAIGFDGKRGDQVEVVNLRFADGPTELPAAEPSTWLSRLAIHQG